MLVTLMLVFGFGASVVYATAAIPSYGNRQQVLQLPATGFPSLLAAGDFNDDGLQDVVVARIQFQGPSTFELTIVVNTGAGGYADGSLSVFQGVIPRVQHPREILIEDFNGDARPDIFIADHGQDVPPYPGYPNRLALSTPDGRLRDASANLPQQPDFTHSAAAADIDRDGDLDLYVGNIYGGNRVPPQILLNDGSGQFTVASGLLPASQTNLDMNKYTASHFVDTNGDGFVDLILGADDFTPSSVVLLNDGTGHFTALSNALPSKPFGPNAICLDIQSSDLEGNGRPDVLLAFTKGDPFYVGRWIQVLRNNGDGAFADATATRLPQSDNNGPWIKFIELVGIDDDDQPDLAARQAEGTAASPSFWLATPGTFAPLPSGFGNTSQNLFVELDIDGDGGRDFLTVQGGGVTEDYFVVRDVGPNLVPGPVSRIAASHQLQDRVRLMWPYVWGAERYELWRSQTPATPGSLIAEAVRTHWDDTSAECAREYSYSVRAVNSAGPGAFGPSLSAVTLPCSVDSIFRDGFESP